MLISVGCSHRPSVAISPPDWEYGFGEVTDEDETFYCLTENDYRSLFTFILDVFGTVGIEGLE